MRSQIVHLKHGRDAAVKEFRELMIKKFPVKVRHSWSAVCCTRCEVCSASTVQASRALAFMAETHCVFA
jgi:hypothetical protein